MKRVIGFVTAIAVASCVAAPARAGSAVPPAPSKKPTSASISAKREAARLAARMAALKLLAPADEYFGPLKMSILGIKNTIKDLGLRYDVNHDVAKNVVPSLGLTEAAIRDWEHKYPHDHDVPRALYYLQRLYAHVLDDNCKVKASIAAHWLFADFPSSPQAKVLHKQLQVEALASSGAAAPSAAPAVQPAVQPAAQPAPAVQPATQQAPVPAPRVVPPPSATSTSAPSGASP